MIKEKVRDFKKILHFKSKGTNDETIRIHKTMKVTVPEF